MIPTFADDAERDLFLAVWFGAITPSQANSDESDQPVQ